MIRTKEDLKHYLSIDGVPDNRSQSRRIYDYFFRDETYYIRLYLRVLRHFEYYINNRRANLINKFMYHYYAINWRMLRRKMGLDLYPNTIGPGVQLFHTYGGKTGLVAHARVGSHVIIRPGVILGYQGDSMRTSLSAPIVDDYVEFSWNVKVFGKIHIGRGALLNTGCVPMTNVPPYAIVIGNPGKVIGFTKTPEEVIEFEKEVYPPEERLSLELLESNYRKFFLSRISEIKSEIRIRL